ncbi:MAG: hypothetical protein Hyperionvirus32_2 [Hyperionvirus sp.]|uniref:Uncharacterized protein n=1 Tax=Hyperionvirus sp. TaxID=2487770 RepID=A0A3G5ABP4_9VIRU|nr:MAG: hypothetical protein Hyperionvirus32_2 [Hyperionvirus sp.]
MKGVGQFMQDPFGFMHCLQPYDLNAFREIVIE